jgi:hypothetical protein
LIQGGTDAAALVLVFDYYEAEEATAGGKAGAHGIDLGEHAVQGEGHVVVFGELEDGEHTFRRAVQIHNLFGQGEDAGFAGDYQEAVGCVAAGPARPLQAAGVDGAVEAVAGEGIGDQSSYGFHVGLLNLSRVAVGGKSKSRRTSSSNFRRPSGTRLDLPLLPGAESAGLLSDAPPGRETLFLPVVHRGGGSGGTATALTAMLSYVREDAGSPLARLPAAAFSEMRASREAGLVPAGRWLQRGYGNAKLLPLIVPVKRETQQVVSSAMTGLVRGWRIFFHMWKFMLRSQRQWSVISDQWPVRTSAAKAF